MTDTYILEIVTQSATYQTNPRFANVLTNARGQARLACIEGVDVHSRMNYDGEFKVIKDDDLAGFFVAPAAIQVVKVVRVETDEV